MELNVGLCSLSFPQGGSAVESNVLQDYICPPGGDKVGLNVDFSFYRGGAKQNYF